MRDKPTPGPWAFDGPSSGTRINDDGGDYAIYIKRDGKKVIIAETFRRTGESDFEPAEANARLFAAAPELLKDGEAAIKRVLEICADLPSEPAFQLQKALLPLGATIAKAKGITP